MIRIKSFLRAIIIFLTFISGSIFLTICTSPIIYWIFLNNDNLSKISNLSDSKLMKNYYVLLNFLLNPLIKKLSFPDFIQSQNGYRHFIDVKNIFLLNNILFIVSFCLSFFVFKFISKNKLWFTLKHDLLCLVLIPIVLGSSFLFIDFDSFFITFHKILFRNSDWLFDPLTDPIINVLPEDFFQMEFIVFFVMLALSLIVLFIYLHRKIKDTIV